MAFTTSVPMLIAKQFGDEIVLANYQSGIYYNLDGTGAQIWLGLKAGKTIEEMAAAFAASCSTALADIAPVVRAFVDRLLEEGIILRGTPQPDQDGDGWTPARADGFAAPELARFDDLRDLLLMDPVHDVSEAGWPLVGGNEG